MRRQLLARLELVEGFSGCYPRPLVTQRSRLQNCRFVAKSVDLTHLGIPVCRE